jgi:hypothetical protein
MGAPTSSYTTTGIALRISGALKPHHHNKVETPSVGKTKYWDETWKQCSRSVRVAVKAEKMKIKREKK